jgi:hypothetical protein
MVICVSVAEVTGRARRTRPVAVNRR